VTRTIRSYEEEECRDQRGCAPLSSVLSPLARGGDLNQSCKNSASKSCTNSGETKDFSGSPEGSFS